MASNVTWDGSDRTGDSTCQWKVESVEEELRKDCTGTDFLDWWCRRHGDRGRF